MTVQSDFRGGTPVGALSALPVVESWLVRALRDWCDGPDGQARVWAALSAQLGPARGKAAMEGLERCLGILFRQGRRRLMRHGCGCGCVGIDEALFAQLVTTSATGEEEDALLMAMLLVPASQIFPLVTAARTLGLELERAALQATAPEPMTPPAAQRWH